MDRSDAAPDRLADTGPPTASAPGADLPTPPAWLDEIGSERAQAWVASQNRAVLDPLADDVEHLRLVADLQNVLEAPDRVTGVVEAAGMLYNLWTDPEHPRGLWRRTTWASYAAGAPSGGRRHDADTTWEVLLDVDAQRRRSGNPQLTWSGAEVLKEGPLAGRRALVTFSDGGTDATQTHELDLDTAAFIPPEDGGFHKPMSKGTLTWGPNGTCLLSAGLADGSLSPAGLPRQARLVRRGEPVHDAPVLITGDAQAIVTKASRDAWGRTWLMSLSALGQTRIWLLPDDAAPLPADTARDAPAASGECVPDGAVRLEVPSGASCGVGPQWVTIELREPWTCGGRTYGAGDLLAAPLEAWLSGDRRVERLFSPTPSSFLAGAVWTRHHLVLTVLDDVVHRLEVCTPPSPDAWQAGAPWGHHWVDLTGAADIPRDRARSDADRPGRADGAPAETTELRPGRALLEVSTAAISPSDSDYLFISASGWTTPPSVSVARLTPQGEVTGMSVTRQAPALFDARGVQVSQHVAVSRDGTRVPYFQVGRPTGAPARAHRGDGTSGDVGPTLLYCYGAFGTSQTPCYQPLTGKAWLERGGTYVVACTRGGGEYGPTWHHQATGVGRHLVVEDLEAVARSLIDRGVTRPERLAVHGGSAGGLLVGQLVTRCPELVGAAVAQVPLMDLQRYTSLLAGPMWVAELGDPADPGQWEAMRPLSPFHALRPGTTYPPLLLISSTADDRVHPAHARTMAWRMQALGAPASYVEMTEGGHTGAAGAAQKASTTALIYTFVRRAVGG